MARMTSTVSHDPYGIRVAVPVPSEMEKRGSRAIISTN